MEVSRRIALQYDVMSDSERIIIIEHNFHDVYSNSNIYKNFLKGDTGPPGPPGFAPALLDNPGYAPGEVYFYKGMLHLYACAMCIMAIVAVSQKRMQVVKRPCG